MSGFVEWHGCYDAGWQGLIVPKAFAHPAKFARGLIERIYAQMMERGMLAKGDLVADCFGGVGLGGIAATYAGLRWLGVELEPRFQLIARRNFRHHRDRWNTLGRTQPIIVQGDSRRFHEIVGAVAGLAAVISSPPYHENQRSDRTAESRDKRRGFRQGKGCFRTSETFGRTEGQVGALPAGNLSAVVTSPPFTRDQPCASQSRLGATIADPLKRIHGMNSEANVQRLPAGDIAAVVTSPPYGKDREPGRRGNATREKRLSPHARTGSSAHGEGYGNSLGQVGREAGETYWRACAQIYASCYSAIRPGGYLVLVVKNYVKKGRIVPLCDDTVALLDHLGFCTTDRVRAMLVTETHEGCLFGGARVTRRERKSFFRRLAEQKGSPAIDWEEVIFAQRP